MEQIIHGLPKQFCKGMEAAADVSVSGGPFQDILVAAMGGSAIAGSLVRDAGIARVPIRIHRSYGLPRFVSPESTIVVVCSFSGDTEEAISAFETAQQKGFSVIGVASRGTLLDLCQSCNDDRISLVRIPAEPPDMQPRSATGYMVGILARLLGNHELAEENALEVVQALPTHLRGFMTKARVRGRRIVPALLQATPVIYTSLTYATVAQIWKIKINENAKMPAFWNVFPELNHNEMVGWTRRQGPFHVVLLRDATENPGIIKRLDLTQELLSEHGVSSVVLPIEGRNLVEKIFSTLLVGDWASYELALAANIDPSPVRMIDDLKDRLTRHSRPGSQGR
jgi:glucose/mannose-6-phosphate isomerase